MVNELTGNDAGVKYVERRDWDVKRRLLSSIENAKKLVSYEPQMEFENGLKKVHEQTFRKSLIKKENWENIGSSAEF